MRPSSKNARGGLTVWKGRRPGRNRLRDFGSSEKAKPRLAIDTPVIGKTQPDPYSQYNDWMKETARPAASIAPIQIVSPAADLSGQGEAFDRLIAAASRSSDCGLSTSAQSGARSSKSVQILSRAASARRTASINPW